MYESAAKLRIDKWLWYARVAKTRSLAAKLVTTGCVRLNKNKVTSASQGIKVDDVLTVTRASHVLIYKVVRLGSRRGPAPEAQLLFADLTPKPEPGSDQSESASSEAGPGRPTKKDRRDILRLKRSFMDE